MRGLLAGVLLGSFLGYGLGARIVLFRKRTGSTPFRLRHLSAAQLAAGALGLTASVGGTIATVWLELSGTTQPWGALAHPGFAAGGVAVSLCGFAGTQWAISAMGSSWRIGVEESERTNLVTGGPFRHVRNPIYSSMLVVGAGLVLLVPNVAAAGAAALLFVAFEIIVRAAEEPYLIRTHGAEYSSYASHVGRFVPLVGRLRS